MNITIVVRNAFSNVVVEKLGINEKYAGEKWKQQHDVPVWPLLMRRRLLFHMCCITLSIFSLLWILCRGSGDVTCCCVVSISVVEWTTTTLRFDAAFLFAVSFERQFAFGKFLLTVVIFSKLYSTRSLQVVRIDLFKGRMLRKFDFTLLTNSLLIKRKGIHKSMPCFWFT